MNILDDWKKIIKIGLSKDGEKLVIDLEYNGDIKKRYFKIYPPQAENELRYIEIKKAKQKFQIIENEKDLESTLRQRQLYNNHLSNIIFLEDAYLQNYSNRPYKYSFENIFFCKRMIVESGLKLDSFKDSLFLGDVLFKNTTFSSYLLFENLVFYKEVRFDKIILSSGFSCTRIKFNDNVQFYANTFTGSADFYKSEFKEGVYFTDTTFEKNALFGEVIFHGKANFKDVGFRGITDFRATFKKDVSFYKAEFSHEADFQEAYFDAKADFSYVEFKGDANFQGASLNNSLLNLTRAKLGKLLILDINKYSSKNSSISLSKTAIDSRNIIASDNIVTILNDTTDRSTYTYLKDASLARHDTISALTFHKKEHETHLSELKKKLRLKRLFNSGYIISDFEHGISHFGTAPFLAIFHWFSMWVIFSIAIIIATKIPETVTTWTQALQYMWLYLYEIISNHAEHQEVLSYATNPLSIIQISNDFTDLMKNYKYWWLVGGINTMKTITLAILAYEITKSLRRFSRKF